MDPLESWFPGPWIGVYTGSEGPDLLIACSRVWNRPVGFAAQPGKNYWIQVGSDDADNTIFDYPISVEVAHGRVVHGPSDPILGIPITTTYVQEDGGHTGAGVFSNHSFEYGGAWVDAANRSAGGCAWIGNVSDPFTSPCVGIG